MVSMKDIAQRCGVSVATVSKALNGQQDIGEDTRRRICDAAEKMGYMTNSAARALKTNRTHPQVQELVDSGLPVVTIDHVFNNRLAVTSDNLCGTEALVRHVYEAGHRRIAFIHGENTAVTQNRLTSYYRALESLGLEAEADYIREGRYHDPERCAWETAALLALPHPPTCILFPDDFSAIGGLNTIAAAGLRVPDDISVAGYDGIYLSQTMSPRLTTYRQDTAALGRTAAARLIELIEKPRTTVMDRTVVTGALLPGGTVAAPCTE